MEHYERFNFGKLEALVSKNATFQYTAQNVSYVDIAYFRESQTVTFWLSLFIFC